VDIDMTAAIAAIRAAAEPPDRPLRRPSHVIVQFLVVEDGERGHPMDVISRRVDLDVGGNPTLEKLADLTGRIRHHIELKVQRR
jgi:hypothetical protein